MRAVVEWGGRLDGLVNNASTFYPTPVGEITEAEWTDLIGSNLKAPLFLSQAAAPLLRDSHGVIINLVDIHSQRPLRNHPVYGPAKAGLAMLTRALAKDLAPQVRVNGVSPGAILCLTFFSLSLFSSPKPTPFMATTTSPGFRPIGSPLSGLILMR